MQIQRGGSSCLGWNDDLCFGEASVERKEIVEDSPDDTTSCTFDRSPPDPRAEGNVPKTGVEYPNAQAEAAMNVPATGLESKDGARTENPADVQHGEPTWPPTFLPHAKLAEAKGWHLLNEVTYGAWGLATAGRAVLQISVAAAGKLDTFSLTSYLPATNEAGLLGGAFAVTEALGTVLLIYKAGTKRSESKAALREHAAGHKRFIQEDPARDARIQSSLSEQRRLLKQIETWPLDEARQPMAEIPCGHDPEEPPLKYAEVLAGLKLTLAKLTEEALNLVKDLEHYIQYERASNELSEATDNIHTLGVATARDVVVQLGGTACNVATAIGKAGIAGVDLAATGVAGGAFSAAMGTMHMAAGMLAWYQGTRRLEDVSAARRHGLDWQSAESRQQRVSAIADTVPAARPADTKSAMAPTGQGQPESAERAESAKLADVRRANDMVDVMMHHREKSFQAIEKSEQRKTWWAKFRMVYGAGSATIGTGLILASTVFGLIPPVGIALGACALILGTVWLASAFVRNHKDRRNTNAQHENDKRAFAEAQRILSQRRQPTVEEMRNNRFLAIDALLKALLDRDRPITRDALLTAMTELGMDKALFDALELRSHVQLDQTYADDRKALIDKLRCCASDEEEKAIKAMVERMTVRSDEAVLKPLRQLFQDFVEGRTSMRQEYERRSGFFAFLAEKLRGKFGSGLSTAPQGVLPGTAPADVSLAAAQPPVVLQDAALPAQGNG